MLANFEEKHLNKLIKDIQNLSRTDEDIRIIYENDKFKQDIFVINVHNKDTWLNILRMTQETNKEITEDWHNNKT